MIILLFTFGTVGAMALPIITAIFGPRRSGSRDRPARAT